MFRDTLGTICAIAGIKETPDDILEGILWNYIKDYLQGFNFSDIELAAMMNAAGELLPKTEHFQLLDIAFLSGIMNKYLEKKREVLTRIKHLQPTPEPEIVETPEDSYNGLCQYVKKHGSFPEFWSWSKVYFHMDCEMMIEESGEYKLKLFAAEKERLEFQLEADILNMKSSNERREAREAIHGNAQMNCRKMMVKKWLKVR